MYPRGNLSGRSGLYRADREVDYMRSNYHDSQNFRPPPSEQYDSLGSRAQSTDHVYRPYRIDPPVDYGGRREHGADNRFEDEDDGSFSNSVEKRKSLRKLLGRFADKTAMQGVGYINSARFWYSKAIWVFLLLAAFGWMIFHLVYLISQFVELPVQTKISLGFSSLQFPAVTVCNMNIVRKSQLSSTSDGLKNLVAITDPGRFDPSAKIPKRKKRFVEDFENFNFDNLTDYGDYYEDPNYRDEGFKDAKRDDLHKVENTFQNLYLSMPRVVRINAGHQIQDMLLACSFNGYKCFPMNFTLVNTPEYGNCFTIQSTTYVTKNPGPSSGLTLIFYTENEEFLQGISQGYGMRLLIHDVGSFPLPAQEGIFISSSFETHIGLRLTDIARITPTYRPCDDGINFKAQNQMEYSRSVCRIFCEQSTMLSECTCYSHEYKEFFYFTNNTNKNKWCRTQKELQCVAKISREFSSQQRQCSCENPCNEKKYSLFPSSRQWPTTEYAITLMQGLCEKFPQKCERIVNLSGDPRTLGLNFLKVNIYYEDLNYEEFKEEPEIATAQFASDVGGAIGLWIGLSILALFEVVQFFIELCAYGVHAWRFSNRKAKQNEKRKQREQTKKQNGYGTKRNQDFMRNDKHWNSRFDMY